MLRAFSLAEIGLVTSIVVRVGLYAEFVNKYYIHSSAIIHWLHWWKKLKINEKGGYQLQTWDNLPQSGSHLTRVNKTVFTVTKRRKLVF